MRCFYALFFVVLLYVSKANGLDLTPDEYSQHWHEWKSFYGKTYESDVLESAHFAVWKNNLEVSEFYSLQISRSMRRKASTALVCERAAWADYAHFPSARLACVAVK